MAITALDVLATRVRFKIKCMLEDSKSKKEFEDWYLKKYGTNYNWKLAKEAVICQSNPSH